eukprot:6966717-Pyramimonas_sp.AAC.1
MARHPSGPRDPREQPQCASTALKPSPQGLGSPPRGPSKLGPLWILEHRSGGTAEICQRPAPNGPDTR